MREELLQLMAAQRQAVDLDALAAHSYSAIQDELQVGRAAPGLLAGWLAGWLLAGWLAGWLAAGRLLAAGWLLAGWLAGCLLAGWLLAGCWLAG
jgi:hypothetical protein